LGLLVLVTGAVGCAFGDRHVALAYPPASTSESPAPRLVPAPAKGITIIVAGFSDERDSSPIGEVRNGFGMHTADVLTDTDVTVWVAKAIARDLSAAGYKVKWAGPATASERIQKSGQVLTTYSRAYMTYEGEVSFMVQLTVDGKQVINKRMVGHGSSGVNFAATGEGYGESLSFALRGAVAELVAQLQPTLRALPPPPPPPAPTPAPAPPDQNAAATPPETPKS
jgi:hypothetical protein